MRYETEQLIETVIVCVVALVAISIALHQCFLFVGGA